MVRQGMVRRPSIDEIRERTYKARDSWWTVIFVDPVAARVVRFLSPYGWATPNRITGASFLLGVVAAGFFSQATRGWLLAGALMFYLSFMLDCVDGKIARLNNNGTIFGTWLDYVLDRIRVLLCSIGLFGGQFMATRHWAFLLAGALVVFLDMFRYLNAQLVRRTKLAIREKLSLLRSSPNREDAAGNGLDDADEAADANGERYSEQASPAELGQQSWYLRLRSALLSRRIRMHVFSGIEFHVIVFIVAPATGLVILLPFAACGLLALFELAVIVRLWQFARSAERQLAVLDQLREMPTNGADAELGSTASHPVAT